MASVKNQLIAAATAMTFLIVLGTFVYHFLEKWSWISSFYFTVVTLTTVGYGDMVPSSDISRLVTSVFIILGVTIMLAAVATIGARYLEARGTKVEARRAKRKEEKESS